MRPEDYPVSLDARDFAQATRYLDFGVLVKLEAGGRLPHVYVSGMSNQEAEQTLRDAADALRARRARMHW